MENQVIDKGFLFPSEFSTINSLSPFFNNHDMLFNSLPQANSSIYDQLGFGGVYMHGSSSMPSLSPFGNIHAEFMNKMSAQEIMDAKAQAASKSHSEAERRRRERINGHLGRLRSLLPSTTKTDKASLLAEVIQHVKELKRQTSELAEDSPLPTELDELTINTANNDDGKFVIKASLCCEDRSNLIPDLIKTLKSLKLRTLKAEITTLGGRIKNILVITGDDDSEQEQPQLSISLIQDALKAVMECGSTNESHMSEGVKRQRTNNITNLL